MKPDLCAATDFMATRARTLDRHRFRHTLDDHDNRAATLAALEAYRNPDGGYGWGLEPDLRSAESQPGPALHAFEVFGDIAPATSPHAERLCEWLSSVTLRDGGLPFALPVTSRAGCAPFWADADSTASSLQISAIVAANAHRVAARDPAVANHPWLDTVTGYCVSAIRALTERPHALVLAFAIRFLGAASATVPEARVLLDGLGTFLPEDGHLLVEGGSAEEYLRPLDFAPMPGDDARRLFSADAIAADLRRLAGRQQADGGWPVDFASYSPAASLEWRGYATVSAVSVLRANGVG
ncbi:hypothetical protein BAY61_08235 [Prauserella marina]|uniref:Uncharacterized protein n=1 Tax=Prauserella marina TaxID=530584 RepID=A0A222VZE4_9PSEU|nr:hypothetical protein [Prauserella marina]ASR39091.1 hypothetical protein BAY61_08235 [Prauserella marina]PWV85306.1 hypothetical protein DES30_1011333 [Prauserella marina]SDC00098.1 hypothetical protein SAMN05421630_1015 [Prauserella marina]